jgi:hypothetical protein
MDKHHNKINGLHERPEHINHQFVVIKYYIWNSNII